MIRSSYTKAEGEKADQAADEISGIADAKIDGDKAVEVDETLGGNAADGDQKGDNKETVVEVSTWLQL